VRYNTPVFVNYETTWYRSHGEIWNLLHEQKAAGEIRRMVARRPSRPSGDQRAAEVFAWLKRTGEETAPAPSSISDATAPI